MTSFRFRPIALHPQFQFYFWTSLAHLPTNCVGISASRVCVRARCRLYPALEFMR
jgi:hypothetical protein